MAPHGRSFSTESGANVQLKDGIKAVCGINPSNQAKSQICYKSKVLEYVAELKWFNIVVIVFLHGLFLERVFKYPWIQNLDLVLFNIAYGNIAAVGISAGVHRLWTHCSYKANLPLRIIWMICYGFAGINPIFHWVRDHRVHHKFTDTNADPHNSKRGFFFSHVGWLMIKKHPDVVEKGKQVDLSDVLEDPVVQFDLKYHIPIMILQGFIIPTIIPPLMWGQIWIWSFLTCLGRYVVTLHLIWSINSVAHMWGNKPYDKSISPTDSHIRSFFTLGEAWHNYHHAFPWAYRFGRFTGYYADMPSFCIDMFAKIGWAYDLKTPSLQLVRKVAERGGDGSHIGWGAHMEIPESAEKEFCDITGSNNNKKDK